MRNGHGSRRDGRHRPWVDGRRRRRQRKGVVTHRRGREKGVPNPDDGKNNRRHGGSREGKREEKEPKKRETRRRHVTQHNIAVLEPHWIQGGRSGKYDRRKLLRPLLPRVSRQKLPRPLLPRISRRKLLRPLLPRSLSRDSSPGLSVLGCPSFYLRALIHLFRPPFSKPRTPPFVFFIVCTLEVHVSPFLLLSSSGVRASVFKFFPLALVELESNCRTDP